MESKIVKGIVFPVKIVFSENAENVDNLLKNERLQIFTPNDRYTRLNRGGRIVIDFGKELHGCLRILVNYMQSDLKSSNVRISLGESVVEAVTHLGVDNADNYHSVRDGVYSLPWNCDFTTSRTGFRFACIELPNSEFLAIYKIVAETEMPVLERKGFFRSSDELLNTIADTAAYTATLCVQNDVIWDGIKRDRLVWMGDLHPEIMTLTSLYGAIPQIKNCLDFADYYPLDSWINAIPAYSAWWIVCLYEYYVISDDREYVEKKIPYLNKILSDFRAIVYEDGTISYKNSKLYFWEDNQFFFDWVTNLTEESRIGWASLVKYAIDKASFILKSFGNDGAFAERLSVDISKNPIFDTSYKQVEAFNLLSGRKTADDVKGVLLSGEAQGMTGFMGYYILTAMAKCGGKEQILKTIKDFYGGMLSLGATTFWEDFDVKWLKDDPQPLDEMPIGGRKNIHRDYGKFCYKQLRHSLCHGWTAGVYAFLTQTVLGITAVESGYRKIKIAPHLIGLNMAEGSVPTPFGDIYVKHEIKDGKLVSVVKVPDEIQVVS